MVLLSSHSSQMSQLIVAIDPVVAAYLVIGTIAVTITFVITKFYVPERTDHRHQR